MTATAEKTNPSTLGTITLAEVWAAGVSVAIKGDQLALDGDYGPLIDRIKESKASLMEEVSLWYQQAKALVEMGEVAAKLSFIDAIKSPCVELLDLIYPMAKVADNYLIFNELITANRLRVWELVRIIRADEKAVLLEGDALAGVVPKILDVRKPLPTSAPVAPLFHKEPVVVDHSQMSLTAPVFEANLEDI